jgi:hypothetical protein
MPPGDRVGGSHPVAGEGQAARGMRLLHFSTELALHESFPHGSEECAADTVSTSV